MNSGYAQAGGPAVSTQPPPQIKRASSLMLLGGLLALVSLVIVLSQRETIREQIRDDDPSLGGRDLDVAMWAAIGGVVVGMLAVAALWVWMARSSFNGRPWVRAVATGLFAAAVIGSISSFTADYNTETNLSRAMNVAQLLTGGFALYYLWTKEAGAFFSAKKARAKARK